MPRTTGEPAPPWLNREDAKNAKDRKGGAVSLTSSKRTGGSSSPLDFLIASKEVYYGWEGSRTTNTETRRGLNNVVDSARRESLRHYGSAGCIRDHRAAATLSQQSATPGTKILTTADTSFTLHLYIHRSTKSTARIATMIFIDILGDAGGRGLTNREGILHRPQVHL